MKTKFYQLIEVSVKANTKGQVSLDISPQLRNQPDQLIIVQNIEVFTDTDFVVSQRDFVTPGLPGADVKKMVLGLYVNGWEAIYRVPLVKFIHTDPKDATPANNYNPLPFEFDDLANVDFNKSYLQFSQASNSSDYVVPIGVTYLRFQRDPQGNFVQS